MNAKARLIIICVLALLIGGLSMGLTPSGYLSYTTTHGQAPADYISSSAAANSLTLIGTRHRDARIHQIIIDALPQLSENGIKTLFVEIPSNQQANIDAYLHYEQEADAIGLWEIIASESYIRILERARALKLNIIAIDRPHDRDGSRDLWMADTINSHIRANPETRGLVIAGARHIMKNIEWNNGHDPSMADLLAAHATFSIVIWPNADYAAEPLGIDTGKTFLNVRDTTLKSMNIKPHLALHNTTDGVIMLPDA